MFSSLAQTKTQIPTPKEIEDQLEKDSRLYFQLSLAEALHCTLFELKSKITEEEMLLWQAYFTIKSKRQEAEVDKIKRKARR